MSSGAIRRDWTHRRLGLGVVKPSDAQLVHTDALLTAVGAREASAAVVTADSFAAALLDFALDVDLTAGIADIDATAIPVELLRLTPGPAAPRRVTWRIAIPAVSTAVAAIVVGIGVLLGRGTPVIVSPTATAAAESRQLLTHAHSLIADAGKASTRVERQRLVTEARADLNHVSRLLPLTATGDRPAIRRQLYSLEEQVRPTPQQGTTGESRANGSQAGPSDNGSSGSSSNGSGDPGTTVQGGTPGQGDQRPVYGRGPRTGTFGAGGGTQPINPSPPPTQPPPAGGAPGSGDGHQGPPLGGGGGFQGPPALSSSR